MADTQRAGHKAMLTAAELASAEATAVSDGVMPVKTESSQQKAPNQESDSLKSDEDTHFEIHLESALDDGKTVVVEERDMSGHTITARWVHTRAHHIASVPVHINQNSSIRLSFAKLRQAVIDAFLPMGYPYSVSGDYLEYQAYDTAQAFCSTITSLLANRSILKGLGVGDASTNATSALLLTIIKDGVSRIATIGFAWRFGLSIEQEAKYYRFIADAFNDSAFFLDLAVPFLRTRYKVIFLIAAEGLRAVCGVSASASKAALSLHFARANNLAELNTKEASQETAVGLVGLLVGMYIVHMVEDIRAVGALMVILVGAHLFFNYRGVRCVALNVLNRQRATILIRHFLAHHEVLTPEQVAKKESILFFKSTIPDSNGDGDFDLSMASSYADMTRDHRDNGAYLIAYKWRHSELVGARILINKCPTSSQENLAIIKAWYEGVLTAWKKHYIMWHMDDSKLASQRSDFLLMAEAVGWNLKEQGIETGAPLRIWYADAQLPRDHNKKDQ